MKFFRKKYVDKILPFVGKEVIKVLVGQRRVGKSMLLLQIMDYLKKEQKVLDDDILFVDKENLAFDDVKNYKDLFERAKDFQYIFLDEVQMIEERERAVLSLHNAGKDIYITGSNSHMLSGDLATALRGRYIKIDVYPFDYKEFLEFHGLVADEDAFEKYLIFGGMPYLINLTLSENVVNQYLKAVGETIILKDIVERYSIRNVSIFHRLVLYLAKNLGNIFSSTNIVGFLKNEKLSVSQTTVLGYLEYLVAANIIHEVPRYHVVGKKVFEVRQKYFFTDVGIRNAFVSGFQKLDISGVLENVVYSNLISNGWEVYVGEIGDKEIDFVCKKNGEFMYLQVAYLLESEKTKQREFSGLQAISDSRPKFVLTMDKGASGAIDGIRWKTIGAFLLENL